MPHSKARPCRCRGGACPSRRPIQGQRMGRKLPVGWHRYTEGEFQTKTSHGELEMDQAPAMRRQGTAFTSARCRGQAPPGVQNDSLGCSSLGSDFLAAIATGSRRTALRFSRGSHTLASSATLRFTDSRGPSRLWQTAAGCARNGNLRKVHSFQDFGLFALALLQHRQRLPHDILGFAVSALFNRPADKFFLVGT
jgi:hypothetical protein